MFGTVEKICFALIVILSMALYFVIHNRDDMIESSLANLEVDDNVKVVRKNEQVTLSGTISNYSTQDYPNIKIEATLYDDDNKGKIVSSKTITVLENEDLDPDEYVGFQITLDDPKGSSDSYTIVPMIYSESIGRTLQ